MTSFVEIDPPVFEKTIFNVVYLIWICGSSAWCSINVRGKLYLEVNKVDF